MHLNPEIVQLSEKRLFGKMGLISFAQFNVAPIWKSFQQEKHSLVPTKPSEAISAAVYPSGFFKSFNPTTPFEKWAAVEVKQDANLPYGFLELIIPDGLYARFLYKGSSADRSFMQSIFSEWLPASEYELDDRPHFEILGPNYRNNDPESEEEIWVPVRIKVL